jgi:outer membrane protein OmpA-like peptidoglycan-associated protein
MKSILYLIIIACIGVLVGCAPSIPPTELINARQAYQHASAGQAAQLVPAELHKAQEALAVAEKSFQDDPKSFRTRDLAYIADRKAKMAEAFATTAAGNAATAKANKDYQTTQNEIVKNTKQDLATQTEITKNTKQDLAVQTEISNNTKQDLAAQTEISKNTKEDLDASERSSAVKTEQLASEQQARLDAENRASVAQADLAKLAAVKEEARGLVITLSGSVLFASNKSELLPSAQDRLNQVADALMATKERKLTVEGHTDSRGSSSYNLGLSQRRADVVRSYIISRGYASDLIEAHGIGKDRPVADNASAEGRANNRRVEIIVDHAASYQESMNK